MLSLSDLPQSAEALLSALVAAIEAQGISVPEAQYVAAGLVPWDGESVTLEIGQIHQGQPGAPVAGSFTPGGVSNFSIDVTLMILRSVSAMEEGLQGAMIPDFGTLDTEGQTAWGDAAAMVNAAVAVHIEIGQGMGFAIDRCVPVGPEGGLAGMRLTFGVSLS